MNINCFDCGREIKPGERVFEHTSGYFDGEMVISTESLEVWCEECEGKRGEK